MVDFSSREKYKEVKETPSENTQVTEETQQRREEQEDIEQRVRDQQRNFLEQTVQEAEPEKIQKQELFSYQTNAPEGEYSLGENNTQKFWEEKRIQEQKKEEERRRRAVI